MKIKDWLLVGIGAAFGILCARQFGDTWWLGLVAAAVGASFGYLSDDPVGRWAKLKLAVRAAKPELVPIKEVWNRHAKVPEKWGKLVVTSILIATSIICWSGVLLSLEPKNLLLEGSLIADFGGLLCLGTLATFSTAVFSSVALIFSTNIGSSRTEEPDAVAVMVTLGVLGNPLGFGVCIFWFVGFVVCHVTLWCLKLFVSLCRFFARATKRFFFYIHDERSVCRAVYAAIGSAIGWRFDQNPIIGFVAGIVVGMAAHKTAQVLKAPKPQTT